MSRHSDVFQMLITLPNVPPKEVAKNLLNLVGRLEAEGTRLRGSRTSLVGRGREDYLELVG